MYPPRFNVSQTIVTRSWTDSHCEGSDPRRLSVSHSILSSTQVEGEDARMGPRSVGGSGFLCANEAISDSNDEAPAAGGDPEETLHGSELRRSTFGGEVDDRVIGLGRNMANKFQADM